MSPNDPNPFDDAVLDALEQGDDEFGGHARGDDVVRPGYFLQELPVPAPDAPQHTMERRGGRAASLVSDPTGSLEAPAPAPAEVSCEACGMVNPTTSRFCSSCGHALHPAEAPGVTDAERAVAPNTVTLISINEDGTDGPRIDLRYADSVVGRAGDVRFPTDAFLSPKHARFAVEQTTLFIEDLYSLNGTYVKLRDETRLTPGDTFLMGRQVLRFEKFEHQIAPKARSSDGTRYMGSPPPGGQFKLLQVGIGGVVQNTFCLHESGAIIGREKGDVIFPRDKFMSGRHAQIFPRDDGHYYLVDLNSSNGTWIKIWERRELLKGDFVFLGQQLFRVEF